MEFMDVVGIDVSKRTLDVKIDQQGNYQQFDNNPSGHSKMLKWATKSTKLSLEKLLFCFEHTGLYSLPLAVYLDNQSVNYCIVPGLEIKRSLGIARGKSDKIDAGAIAEYAFLRKHKLKLTKLPSKNILCLKSLISLRHRMVVQRAGYKASLSELGEFVKRKENKLLFVSQERMIRDLTKKIDAIEAEMIAMIKIDEQLCKHYQLITSVKGIGLITGANFLVITNCFTAFENWRQFACYAGIAPFQNQSGTSLNSKNKVNHMANKKMKALLNLAASSAILCDPELKTYYQARVKKGKSKMSTLNVIRNKIVARVFAVVKRGTPYATLAQHAA